MMGCRNETHLTDLGKLVFRSGYELGNCVFWYDNFKCTPGDKRYRDSRRKKIGS